MNIFSKGLVFFSLVSTPVWVYAGVFSVVPYGNNPDKFCREGMPSHGWKAVDPRSGSWRPTGKRRNVNHMWIPVYQTICPAGAMADFQGTPDSSYGASSQSLPQDSFQQMQLGGVDPAAIP